jgi:hypothetical protein
VVDFRLQRLRRLLSAPERRGRIGVATLVVVVLGALSITANVIQLSGSVPGWSVVATVAILVVLVLLMGLPFLAKSFRGTWLFQVIRDTGLLDVESRADRRHRLPPERVFEMSNVTQVLMSGVLDQVLQNCREQIDHFLLNGGSLRLMIIHPEAVRRSLSTSWAGRSSEWTTYWITNCNEAQVAVDAILDGKLEKHVALELRFMLELPPYLGTLALDAGSTSSAGPGSFVRVQPIAPSQYIGRGTVITFGKHRGRSDTPFDYFAADLESQWHVAVVDQEYLRRRRAALAASSGAEKVDGEPPRTEH